MAAEKGSEWWSKVKLEGAGLWMGPAQRWCRRVVERDPGLCAFRRAAQAAATVTPSFLSFCARRAAFISSSSRSPSTKSAIR